MAGIVDSCLWIKVMALWSFPCLYREAIRLQCFPPTRYVSGRGHAHISTWRPLPDLLNTAIYGPCFIVWLYYARSYTVALSLGLSPTMWWYPDNFFFCLVCRLTWKKKTKKKQKKLKAMVLWFTHFHVESTTNSLSRAKTTVSKRMQYQ